jgi:hypothetical protein
MDGPTTGCRRNGVVSVWVGSFPTLEAAESYFGIPDEIGAFLPPEGFATDLGVEIDLLEKLEVNFERIVPRPLGELLVDATSSATFRDQVMEAASRLGIATAQGIALVYDFDYQAKPGWQPAVGPLNFIGTFPSGGEVDTDASPPRRDPRIEIWSITDAVL